MDVAATIFQQHSSFLTYFENFSWQPQTNARFLLVENIVNPRFYFLFRNGISFKTLSGKSNHATPDWRSGWKHSKIRITGLVAANTAGVRLSMFVNGKAKNPRCFKNIKTSPCIYQWQKKAGWAVYYLKSE